ncbi:hypothetical protein COOONC_01615 [Cooperia oncophora]
MEVRRDCTKLELERSIILDSCLEGPLERLNAKLSAKDMDLSMWTSSDQFERINATTPADCYLCPE